MLWQLYGNEIRNSWPVIRTRLPSILSMGFFGFTVFNVLFYFGAHYTTAINIGILQGSIPVFVMAGAFVAHGSRPTPLQIVGVMVTLAGVATVATQGQPQKILDLDLNRGDLAMLVACALYALYAVALPGRPKMPGPAFFTLLAIVAAATSLPLAVLEIATGNAGWPTPKGWAITLFVAIFPSCLSQLFFMRGIDLIGPARAGIFVNLVPVFAAALGVAIIGEPFAWYHGAALALVGCGIWLAQRKPGTR